MPFIRIMRTIIIYFINYYYFVSFFIALHICVKFITIFKTLLDEKSYLKMFLTKKYIFLSPEKSI